MAMNISNAEKQARFRKKEELKRFADQVFREGQMALVNLRTTPQEILRFLNEAIDLPAGWTEEDYKLAVRKLEQFRMDLFSTPDQIAVDIHESRNSQADFMTAPDPGRFIAETKAGIDNAHALAAHIISALKLSSCTDAEQAAALMEAVRLVARTLANRPKVPSSNATTMCLAALGPHYERPDWFAANMAKALARQLGEDLAGDVAERLSSFDHEAFP